MLRNGGKAPANVVVRATDTNGDYAEFSVVIEVKENHLPTKKADAPDKLSVFVPVGLYLQGGRQPLL